MHETGNRRLLSTPPPNRVVLVLSDPVDASVVHTGEMACNVIVERHALAGSAGLRSLQASVVGIGVRVPDVTQIDMARGTAEIVVRPCHHAADRILFARLLALRVVLVRRFMAERRTTTHEIILQVVVVADLLVLAVCFSDATP